METYIKKIDDDLAENKKPTFNKQSIVWTDTSGASLGYKIKMFFMDIKHFFQRGRYGYSRPDVWDLNNWFLTIMPKMIGDLIEGHIGYPGTEEVPTNEAWEEILKKMKFYFEEANEATCSKKNEYEDTYNFETISYTDEQGRERFDIKVDDEVAWNNYLEREKELKNYRDKMLSKGMKLFTKHFDSLWD